MRWRGVLYAGLVALAVVLGLLAAGLPSRRHDPPLKVATTNTASTVLPTLPTTTSTTTAATTTTTSIPAHAATAVTVLAANASAVDGAAKKLTTALSDAGYKTLPAAGATAKTATTNVYYVDGYQGDAIAVAKVFGAPAAAVLPLPPSVPVPSVTGANVVVVLGADLAAAVP